MMDAIKKFLNTMISNDKIQFIATKYITYVLYFLISIIVANKLGLFYFGLYGFMKLLLQYFSYSNLGVNYSSIVLMSEQKDLDNKKNNKLLSSSIIISVTTFVLFYLLFICIYNNWYPELNVKYQVNRYLWFVLFIVIFKQVNQIFINTNRVYNNLKIINWAYIIPCFGEFIALFLGGEEVLFYNICWAMLVSNGLVTLIFFLRNAFSFRLEWDTFSARELTNRGLKLLLYNVSFYFIILLAKSFMSSHYDVEDFAQYSFSYNISDAVMLLNNSISFLIYPSLLNSLHNTTNNDVKYKIISCMQDKYMLIANLIVIIAYAVLPLLKFIVPDYIYAGDILSVLLMSQLLVANTFTLTTNLIQCKKEIHLIVLGIITIIITYVTSLYLYSISGNIVITSYALVIAMILYNIGVVFLNKFILKVRIKDSVKLINPIYFAPIISAQFARIFCEHNISTLIYIIMASILFTNRYIKLFKEYRNG